MTSSEVPKLSKEQLIQRRAEILKCYKRDFARRRENLRNKDRENPKLLTRIVEEKSIEETWKDLREIAKKLTTMNSDGINRAEIYEHVHQILEWSKKDYTKKEDQTGNC
ncbi:unnamed protein product [Caenorhabditis angaria]|uniref:Uncharacterized protein n=1 Tax=Caenorhabditis angaria TaxID=860376 RepID=A0A9P1MXX0_9PELO|nr:unnamed protein product [Caenorhabditis angaria]